MSPGPPSVVRRRAGVPTRSPSVGSTLPWARYSTGRAPGRCRASCCWWWHSGPSPSPSPASWWPQPAARDAASRRTSAPRRVLVSRRALGARRGRSATPPLPAAGGRQLGLVRPRAARGTVTVRLDRPAGAERRPDQRRSAGLRRRSRGGPGVSGARSRGSSPLAVAGRSDDHSCHCCPRGCARSAVRPAARTAADPGPLRHRSCWARPTTGCSTVWRGRSCSPPGAWSSTS